MVKVKSIWAMETTTKENSNKEKSKDKGNMFGQMVQSIKASSKTESWTVMEYGNQNKMIFTKANFKITKNKDKVFINGTME